MDYDAGALAFLDCAEGFGAGRIVDADEAEESHLVFDVVAGEDVVFEGFGC